MKAVFQRKVAVKATGGYCRFGLKDKLNVFTFTIQLQFGWGVTLIIKNIFMRPKLQRHCLPLFLSWFEPTWDPDKQTKIFSNSFSILPGYQCASYGGVSLQSGHHTEESDSAMCIIPQSEVCMKKIFLKTSRYASHRRDRHWHLRSQTPRFAVCIRPQSQALWCASHRGVKLHGVLLPRSRLRGVHHTANSSASNFSKIFEVCILPRNQAPQCAPYCGVKLQGVHKCASHRRVKLHTAELLLKDSQENSFLGWNILS